MAQTVLSHFFGPQAAKQGAVIVLSDSEDAEQPSSSKKRPSTSSESQSTAKKRKIDIESGQINNWRYGATAKATKQPEDAKDCEAGPSRLPTNETSPDQSQPKGKGKKSGKVTDPTARHEAFKKKLLGPSNPLKSNSFYLDKEHPFAPTEPTTSTQTEKADKSKGKGKETATKYTPLETQFIELKKKHPDTLLILEVGYKFMFMGDDAVTASKILNIGHFFQRHFYTAMVPEARLHIHIKRLLQNGYRVGVVRQKETAALKKVSENKNGPFSRELTDLYTLATWVDDIDLDDSALADSETTTGSILCIVEDVISGKGTDEKTRISIVSVQPSTSDVIYDEFEDGFIRSELECRLLHLKPGEVLIEQNVSKTTVETIKFALGNTGTAAALRIDRFTKKSYDKSLAHINDFMSTPSTSTETDTGKVLETVAKMQKSVVVAFSAIIRHLDKFSLSNVARKGEIRHFTEKTTMNLNGNTLRNLEIFANTSDSSQHGSLLWLLDRCKTAFGRRQLRRWIGHPLTSKSALQERLDCVEELVESKDYRLGKLRGLLIGLPDLEKGLARVHCKRIKPLELVRLLLALQRVAGDFKPSEADGFKSGMLKNAVAALPSVRDTIADLLKDVVQKAARDNDIPNMFTDEAYEEIVDAKDIVACVEVELQEELKSMRKVLKKPALQFITIAQEEFLVEVRISEADKAVPSSWLKINSTKHQHRYRSPKTHELMEERARGLERLAATAQECYKRFLDRLSAKHLELREIIRRLAVVDCLFSLADRSNNFGYTKPVLLDEPAELHLEAARHPMVEQISSDPYVPNDVHFSRQGLRTMCLTGSNMGGKTSLARMCALIVIMAQIGCYVPATACKLGLFDAVFTRMGASDEIERNRSTFMVELGETSEILRLATPNSLIILDELGRGTSSVDGLAVALAVLNHIVNKIKATSIFITHYAQLLDERDLSDQHCQAWHMSFVEALVDGVPDITFLYKVERGGAKKSHGLNVARLAGLPPTVLQTALEKAANFEKEVKQRLAFNRGRRMFQALQDGSFQVGDARELLKLVNGYL